MDGSDNAAAYAEHLQPAGKTSEAHSRCERPAGSGSCSPTSAVELGMAHLVSKMDSKSSTLGLHSVLWAVLTLAVMVAWLLAEVSPL